MYHINDVDLLTKSFRDVICSSCEKCINSNHQLCPWRSISGDYCDEVLFISRFCTYLVIRYGKEK